MVYFSGDINMIEVFKEGDDIYVVIVVKVYKISIDKVICE